jgi:SAM-dependent methyltransferase
MNNNGMRIEKRELENLLDAVATTDYISWNKERILSCIEELQSRLSLSGMKTLDLGHDTRVGLLLAKTGVDLVGNVAPIEEIGSLAPPTQPSQFQLPNGEICKWQLDPFDFESIFPYEDAVFDLVTAFEVIEHVVGSPRRFVREIKRVLKPGGHFFLGTPNVNSWPKIVRQFQHAPIYDSKPYSQDFGPRHFMCHVYEYSPWELKTLLKSEGFEIVSFRTWDPYPSDPRGLRNSILRTLVSLSLFVSGYFRESALQFKDRGHQIGLLARSI